MFNMVTSHVIGTDLLHFACIFSELATLWVVLGVPWLSEGGPGTRGYFASRNNGIMDNEEFLPSS